MNPSPVRRPLVRRDDGKLTGPPRRRRCPSPRDDRRRHSCHARGTHSKSLQMTGNADRPRSIRFENLMNRCDRARDEPVRVNCHGIFHPVDTNKLHTLISPPVSANRLDETRRGFVDDTNGNVTLQTDTRADTEKILRSH